MLVQINKENSDDWITNINYDDHKMIISKNSGNTNDTDIFWLENNILIKNRYTLIINNAYPWRNSLIEEKLNDDYLLSYNNGILNKKNCITQSGSFPYINSSTSYEHGEITHYKRYKVEQKGINIFEKYNSKATNENKEDTYELSFTFYLDKNNFISRIEREDFTMKFEYTYYP